MRPPRIERYPPLEHVDGLAHGMTLRVPEVATSGARSAVVSRLMPHYRAAASALGFDPANLVLAEQVHGTRVGRIDSVPEQPMAATDALMTTRAGVLLGILVADCCPVFIVDPGNRAICLVHSGRSGTRGEILRHCLGRMRSEFRSRMDELRVHLGPCIHPPDYEVDIPAALVEQAESCGIVRERLTVSPESTSSDLTRYYSYRIEKGQTGRMMAMLGWLAEPAGSEER